MSHHVSPFPSVDEMLRNAELQSELEPYYDEAISRVDRRFWTIQHENDFLASMLAWETAPVLPIYRWFEPELRVPRAERLTDADIATILNELIWKLYEKRIVLDFTDHLTDRELYSLIAVSILPSHEKYLPSRSHYIHWDCSYSGGDPYPWLTYYATDEERMAWSDAYHQPLPDKQVSPYFRDLPQQPL
ncbi:MAG: hypothetical protein ACRC46_10105 [Thermoguttaceae bacterium]